MPREIIFPRSTDPADCIGLDSHARENMVESLIKRLGWPRPDRFYSEKEWSQTEATWGGRIVRGTESGTRSITVRGLSVTITWRTGLANTLKCVDEIEAMAFRQDGRWMMRIKRELLFPIKTVELGWMPGRHVGEQLVNGALMMAEESPSPALGSARRGFLIYDFMMRAAILMAGGWLLWHIVSNADAYVETKNPQ